MCLNVLNLFTFFLFIEYQKVGQRIWVINERERERRKQINFLQTYL